jgi:membrane protein
MTLLDRLRNVPGRVDARLEPLRSMLPYRAYARYGAVRGNVLAGGIAYFAFFSIFPALAIGFTIFAVLLGNQEDLQVQVVQYLNSSLGSTVISYHEGQTGVVSIEQLVRPDVLTTAGVVGLVTLIFSGLGWISALRDGIQAVFAAREETNFVVLKLLDLLLLLAAGLTVVASVVIGVAVNVASGQVLDLLGISRDVLPEWTVNLLGQLALVIVDAVIFAVLFHRLSGTGVPMADVVGGALVAAIGFTVLKIFASGLLRATSNNRFLATYGLLVGLLVWMNLVARLLLIAAAWSATVAHDRGHLHTPDPLLRSPRPGGPGEEESPAPPAADGHPRRPLSSPVLLVAGFLVGAVASRVVRRRASRPDGH